MNGLKKITMNGCLFKVFFVNHNLQELNNKSIIITF